MKQDRIEEGRFSANGRGLGTVTEEMVRKRAAELALIAGRPTGQVLDSDVDQARRELTGRERLVPEPSAEETVLESERLRGVERDDAGRVEPVPAPDEQTFAEKLVEEGVEDAEQDQMEQAARDERRREPDS
jgi:hypothetical protein